MLLYEYILYIYVLKKCQFLSKIKQQRFLAMIKKFRFQDTADGSFHSVLFYQNGPPVKTSWQWWAMIPPKCIQICDSWFKNKNHNIKKMSSRRESLHVYPMHANLDPGVNRLRFSVACIHQIDSRPVTPGNVFLI